MTDFQSINGLISDVSSLTTETVGNSTLDKDAFLQLLVAQLKVQDPTNPQDATEFTSQIAQFTELEQLTNLNETMVTAAQTDAILAQSINNTLASTIIGKDAKVEGGEIQLTDGEASKVGYDLTNAAQTLTLEITDSSGNVVRTITETDVNAGEGTIEWDGKDEKGNDLADGSYSVSVTATSYDGTESEVSPLLIGTIEAVRYTSDGAVLIVDGVEVAFGDVLEIRDPDDPTNVLSDALTWLGG